MIWLFASRAQKVSVVSNRSLDVFLSHVVTQNRATSYVSSAFYHPYVRLNNFLLSEYLIQVNGILCS